MLIERSVEDNAGWDEVLKTCDRSDFYHSSGFHQLARENGEGEPVLLDWREGNRRIALPLLLRGLNSVPGLDGTDPLLRDATSVYGYGGPVWTGEPDEGAAERWRADVRDWARARCVVSVFSRLHPLWDASRLLAGLGSVAEHGTTVSIDLTAPAAVQRAAYRDDHKRGVNKLRRMGYTVSVFDDPRPQLERFTEIYLGTMQRVGSTDYYRFDRAYFERLLGCCQGVFRLFVVWHGEAMAAAGLFSLHRGIVQFHLSGTDANHFKLGPSKLMIDEVRLWAAAQGASILHLGGGLGGQHDSLFEFKAGFGDQRHVFRLWTWICDSEHAIALTERKCLWHADRGEEFRMNGYFPPYRQPAAPNDGGRV